MKTRIFFNFFNTLYYFILNKCLDYNFWVKIGFADWKSDETFLRAQFSLRKQVLTPTRVIF